MSTIDILKEQEAPTTPLFLFSCVLSSGATEYWATNAVTIGGIAYGARLLQNNLFTLQASSDAGLDGAQKVTITLANADSHFSELEREVGFKGASVTIQFLFFDLVANTAVSETAVVFRGIANPPEEITESTFRITFTNRLNLQRILLPDVQIERQCPWSFPATLAQRQEAFDGGAKGAYSAFHKCGYSPDIAGGLGNLNGSVPYTTCDYTRTSCIQRGMFNQDASSNTTCRFGGIEFVPPQIQVRAFGQQGSSLSAVLTNTALYNDFVPLVYGTAWYEPPLVLARNDGNLTRMEILLGMGVVEGVVTVLVNDISIPQAQAGANMTATGWFTLVTPGTTTGAFDPNFTDSSGNPLGDPYGSMAMLSVVVPNLISNGQTLPNIQILLNGLQLEQFDETGASLGSSFTNNPAWVLLDVLRRAGWLTTDVDLVSFATAAAYCAELIETTDVYGNTASTPRFECNLVIQNSMSAAEVATGVRNASSLMLTYGSGGLLTLRVENTLALQQAALPDGSNSTEELEGGWPAYEFSDSSDVFSGIARKANGSPTIRLWSKSGADTPNRLTVEFQDEFNQYQQDSLSLVDIDDAILTGRQLTATYTALGLPNFDQATRMLQLQLNKTIDGYTFIDLETTVKGIRLAPGDLITITYLKEGLSRQPFRVVKLSPGQNYQTLMITAQWHDDSWYTTGGAGTAGGRTPGGASVGLPLPLVGSLVDTNGIEQFGIVETDIESADGSFTVQLAVSFTPPTTVSATGAAIPLVSLSPNINPTGGTLAGDQILYYAVSAVDGTGAQSALSFTVRANIPSGTNTNAVSLTGLSFSPSTASFDVYRGLNPTQLLQIAASRPVAASYIDSGATATLAGPPDPNYDHANFYWRLELQPEVVANIQSSTTIGNSTLGMLPDDFQSALVRITRGTGATQERAIVSNDATTLTVSAAWTVIPDSTSYFVVADSTWNFGGFGALSPVDIQVPNRAGTTVEISGRSANVLNEESSPNLNPLTRWQIGGGEGIEADADVPPLPIFGLDPGGQGTIELLGIGFSTLTNTHTISAGTLTLFYWDELESPSTIAVAANIAPTDTTINLTVAGTVGVGGLVQIESEIMAVTAVLSAGLQLQVTRGSHASTAAAHLSGVPVYELERNVTIVSFFDDFFGSPASGSYSHSIFLPDVRIGAAEFFVTNLRGNSPVASGSFGGTADQGLRTLAGGELSIQVSGYLAIQTNAAPPVVVSDTNAPRDIFAVLLQAPSGAPVQLQIRQNSTVYCTLTIADGATTSNTVDGFGLPPLTAGAQINLDILSVPGAADTLPGSDLTVTIRL